MPLPRILKFLPVFWRLIGVAAPIALGIAIGQWISPWLPTFSKYLATLGWWAPLAFVAAYVVVVVLMLPAFLMIMASGAVFGTVEGTFLSMVGALTGGTCAFLIARHGARDFVVRKLSGHPTLSDRTSVV